MKVAVVVGLLAVGVGVGVSVEAAEPGRADQAQVRRGTPPRTAPQPKGTQPSAGKPQTVRIPVGPEDVLPPELQEARQRREEEQKQWGRDLVFWKQRLAEPADDAETQRALYHVGVGLERLERWTEARQSFERLVAEFPDGPWCGQAHVRLIDLALERSFDPAAAAERSQSALEWIERRLKDRPGDEAAFPIYRRAGLLAYLRQEFGEARRLFAQAEPLTPPDEVGSDGRADVLERVVFLTRARRLPTPRAVLAGDRNVAALLVLADVRHAARQFERTAALCQAVLRRAAASTGPRPSETQQSYAHYLHGQVLLGLSDPKQRSQARDELLAARQSDPEAAWAGDALFLAANTFWNLDRSAEEAIALWRQVLDEYPDSREAPRAAYFIGIAYELTKQYPEAKVAFARAQTQFPESPLTPLIAEHLKSVEQELSRSGR